MPKHVPTCDLCDTHKNDTSGDFRVMPPEKRNRRLRDVARRGQGVWLRPGDWLVADEDGVVLGAMRLV